MSFALDKNEFDDALNRKDYEFLWSAYEELRKQKQQVEIHCAIREKALYDIRKLTQAGSEISKIAGHALCYGNYARGDMSTLIDSRLRKMK